AILDDERLAQNSAERGQQLLDGLRDRLLGHPLVRDIRGRGLLVGLELGVSDAQWLTRLAPMRFRGAFTNLARPWIALPLLQHRIVCQPAAHRWNILK